MSYSFRQYEHLNGPRLTLKRVEAEDLISLANALISSTTWFSQTRNITTPEIFRTYFEKILARETLPLAAIYQGEFVGMSVFQYPTENFTRVEIGFSWVSDQWQRTFVNSEMKFLMLGYAFEVMKVKRVEFSVHPDNVKSNDAMKRLGATFEGMLRKWRFLPGLVPDDGNRNIYSILDDEWPEIQARLKSVLSR